MQCGKAQYRHEYCDSRRQYSPLQNSIFQKTYAKNDFKQNLDAPYANTSLIQTGMTKVDLFENELKIARAIIPAIFTACPNNQP
jgi:hypothetical protein